jgi:hypothetical protein
MDATSPGNFLTISHPAADIDARAGAEAARRCNARTAEPATFRSLAEVTRFFDGLEPVEPGAVRVPERAAAAGQEQQVPGGKRA